MNRGGGLLAHPTIRNVRANASRAMQVSSGAEYCPPARKRANANERTGVVVSARSARGRAERAGGQSPPLILEEGVHERADVDRSPAARQVVARARVEAGEGGVA